MPTYGTRPDLATHGLPGDWLAGVSDSDQDAALEAASRFADGYLSLQYDLPISVWGRDLTRVVCHIASWDLMCRQGYDPDTASNKLIRQRYEDALQWLRDVAAGRLSPPEIVDSTPDVPPPGEPLIHASVSTRRSRRWERF